MPRFNLKSRQIFAEHLLAGAGDRAVSALFARQGFGRAAIARQLQQLSRDPVFLAARAVVRRFAKERTLLEAFAALHRQSADAHPVPAIERPSPREFFENFYYANRPVVLRGLMRNWPARRRWTPEYFRARYGHHTVEISRHRDRAGNCDLEYASHRSRVLLREFIRWIQDGKETNDYYITARNNLLYRPEFQGLWRDFSFPRGLLDPKQRAGNVNLWLGPGGTVTGLHHDDANNLFGQVYGRKRIKLISPFELENVYNHPYCFSQVDLEQIDYRRFPRMKNVRIIDVILEPGEFLFIPLGWWHWVKSLGPSISLSFTNFIGQQLVWKFPPS